MPSFPYLRDLIVALVHVDIPLPIPMFGLFVAFAVVIATSAARRDVQKAETIERLPSGANDTVVDLAWITLLAGTFGARVFDILDHVDAFVQNPAALIFTRGGFSIYGGLCFGVLAGILFVRRRRLSVTPMLDAVAPALMLGYGIGRIGCQVSGDGDWGIAANMALKPDWLPAWFWAQNYAGNILGVSIPLPGVYPTPIYETAAALLLFLALRRFAQRTPPIGSVFALYLLFAGFERLLIEKIRVNVRFSFGDMTFTQAELISVAMIVGGTAPTRSSTG